MSLKRYLSSWGAAPGVQLPGAQLPGTCGSISTQNLCTGQVSGPKSWAKECLPEGFFNLSGVEKRARGPQKGKDHGPQANAGRPEARDWLLGPLQLTRVFRLTSAAEDSLEAEAKKKCLECSAPPRALWTTSQETSPPTQPKAPGSQLLARWEHRTPASRVFTLGVQGRPGTRSESPAVSESRSSGRAGPGRAARLCARFLAERVHAPPGAEA
ncbi:unnamed protein product [Rangifer tarandus platyrhynchus]|uniref:Uncharacterized protein n=2 Tax=Rangifer tarandus platyrhynchus TaxID=3082113 RepID=A0ABN8ZTP0_RANTA|nr:unnamed protein product [Rangifer tarandus platyrhynchus]CAI9711008.1 unnamed protein product [Rangifer tarandus platyrhynchus]